MVYIYLDDEVVWANAGICYVNAVLFRSQRHLILIFKFINSDYCLLNAYNTHHYAKNEDEWGTGR